MKLSLPWKLFLGLAGVLLTVNLIVALALPDGRAWTLCLAASTVALLALWPLTFWAARRVTRPLEEMREAAERVGRGDFSRKTSPQKDELGALSAALNEMSAQIESRMRNLTAEKTELAVIVASMIEGVLVVDTMGKIRLANEAFRQQFQIGDEAIGKTVLEVVRNVALHEFVGDSLRADRIVARELQLLNPAERTFALAASQLRSSDAAPHGAVIVFHDITRIKKLENMRKEFVANVSHELRTPLAIIKGYVETLLDPQEPDADTRRQFLGTVQKHAHRLEALIADLLTISALESQRAELRFETLNLRDEAAAVVEELALRARDKSVRVTLEIPAELSVRADSQRLHQVFLNLLDNALKYTPPQGTVRIASVARASEVEISISDNGPGIAAEHLPHIFERFYRVDKARSRELGGTGLGLSIVKHIVQAHGGRVWAESEMGNGSRFYFTLQLTTQPK